MKFFMPLIEDPVKAEEVYQDYKRPVLSGWDGVEITNRRIYKLSYRHDGEYFDAVVGGQDGAAQPGAGGLVIAIYETTGKCFTVVPLWYRKTPPGLHFESPVLVGLESVLDIEEFEVA